MIPEVPREEPMKPIPILVTTLALVPTQSAWTGGDARPPQNPSPQNPVPTKSRPHKIPVPLRIFADQPPKLAVSVVEGAVQPRSAAFREGHGFRHAESYPCSPDPTAHVGADALVRPVRQCRRERPARAVASKGLGFSRANIKPLRVVILNERRFLRE